MKTATEIIKECNELARTFYSMHGCEVDEDFYFFESLHPAELGCWNMAVMAYYHIEGTDIEDVLEQFYEDQDREDEDSDSEDSESE